MRTHLSASEVYSIPMAGFEGFRRAVAAAIGLVGAQAADPVHAQQMPQTEDRVAVSPDSSEGVVGLSNIDLRDPSISSSGGTSLRFSEEATRAHATGVAQPLQELRRHPPEGERREQNEPGFAFEGDSLTYTTEGGTEFGVNVGDVRDKEVGFSIRRPF